MKLYYRLPESNKELYVEVASHESKFFTLIYGPNGIGKTSFTNSIESHEKNKNVQKEYTFKIFSRRYIHKNVYVNNTNGTKVETIHNQHWGDVFLGSEINQLISNIEAINALKDKVINDFENIDFKNLGIKLENSWSNEELKGIFKSLVSKKEIEESFSVVDLPDNLKELDYDALNLDIYKNISVVLKDSCEININSIKKEISKILNKSLLKIVNEIVDIYNDEIYDKLTNFNDLIKSYNSSLTELKLLNDAIMKIKEVFQNEFNYTIEIKNWITQGIKIHNDNNFSKCLYCGNGNLSLVSKHKIVLSDKITKKKDEIEKFITKFKNVWNNKIKTLLKETKDFDVCKSISANFSKLEIYLNNINLDLDVAIDNATPLDKIEHINVDQIDDDLLKSFLIHNNKYYEDEAKKIFFEKELLNNITKLNDEVDQIIPKNIEFVKEIINSYKSFLGLEVEIDVKKEKSPGQRKIKTPQLLFQKNNINLAEIISEGQKFKFALILFIEEVKKELKNFPEKNFLLIFDDPIDSADMFTYFSFKSILINKLFQDNKKRLKVIVLTHNIDYSAVQFNTKLENLKNMEFIRMYREQCVYMDYKELFTNDKIMFLQLHKKLMDSIVEKDNKITLNKDYLIIYLTLSRKFFEQFLEGIYVSQTKQNIDVDQFTISELIKNISNKINNKNVKKLLDQIESVWNTLNKIWLAGEYLKSSDVQKIITLVIEVNKLYYISPTEQENEILEDKIKIQFDEKTSSNSLKDIKFDEWNDKKYLLAAKVFAKKDKKQNSELEFIKSFLRHPNSNFYKPFIAIDEEMLNLIIDDKPL